MLPTTGRHWDVQGPSSHTRCLVVIKLTRCWRHCTRLADQHWTLVGDSNTPAPP